MGTRQNIDIDIDLTAILNQIDEEEVIRHYSEEVLLMKMGYDPDICFKSDKDLKRCIEADPQAYDIELKGYFESMNDVDIYDRFIELLGNNKLTYQQWDKILSKYE